MMNMKVTIYQLLEGAKQAKGLTVIIDVFRAFSLECYAFNNEASNIIAVGDIKLAYALKKENPDYILIGERNERIPEGFDFGNSPTHIQHINFKNKTIVHTTSAGTQGLVNAINADERITGSFVNTSSIVRYIKVKNPEYVSLVCMGYSASEPTEEDTFCAEYIKSLLEETSFNLPEKLEIIKQTSGKRLFLPENQEHSPMSDFYLCTDVNKFDFVLKAEPYSESVLNIKKVDF